MEQINTNSLKSKEILVESILAVIESKLRIIMAKKMSIINTKPVPTKEKLEKQACDSFFSNNFKSFEMIGVKPTQESSPINLNSNRNVLPKTLSLATIRPSVVMPKLKEITSRVICKSISDKDNLFRSSSFALLDTRSLKNKVESLTSNPLEEKFNTSKQLIIINKEGLSRNHRALTENEEAESCSITNTNNSLQIQKASGTCRDYYSLSNKIDTQATAINKNNSLKNLNSCLLVSKSQKKICSSIVEQNIFNMVKNLAVTSTEKGNSLKKCKVFYEDFKKKKLEKFGVKINYLDCLKTENFLQTTNSKGLSIPKQEVNSFRKKCDKDSSELNSRAAELINQANKNESLKEQLLQKNAAKKTNQFFLAHLVKKNKKQVCDTN